MAQRRGKWRGGSPTLHFRDFFFQFSSSSEDKKDENRKSFFFWDWMSSLCWSLAEGLPISVRLILVLWWTVKESNITEDMIPKRQGYDLNRIKMWSKEDESSNYSCVFLNVGFANCTWMSCRVKWRFRRKRLFINRCYSLR